MSSLFSTHKTQEIHASHSLVLHQIVGIKVVYFEVYDECDSAHVLQVEEEMEGLREIYMRRPEEDEEEEEEREGKEADNSNIRTTSSSSSPEKKKQVDACWQETLQRFLAVQELGNNYINTVSMVTRLSGTGISESSRIHFAL